MNIATHIAVVRTGIKAACVALGLALVAQLLLRIDLHGLPFLIFGLAVGALAVSLFARILWERLAARRQ